jgi:hypothetical protein
MAANGVRINPHARAFFMSGQGTNDNVGGRHAVNRGTAIARTRNRKGFVQMTSSLRVALTSTTIVACLGFALPGAHGQEPPRAERVEIPLNATALEGIPKIRLDVAEGDATRRVLDAEEAAKSRLRVRVVEGRYYWTSRENRLLRWDSSGPFAYLSSEPGTYIRLTRLYDTLSYVEHVESASGSVTWWGELRVILSK